MDKKNLFDGFPETEIWVIEFMGKYAYNLLAEKNGGTFYPITERDLCWDRRRTITVIKTLEKRGLIKSSIDYPIQEAFEKEAPQYGEKPQFEIKGSYSKRDPLRSTNINTPHKNYLNAYYKLSDLSLRECIYVYFHQDDYEIIKVQYQPDTPCYSPECKYSLRIFPKTHIKELQDVVVSEKIIHQARKYLNTFLKKSFDRPFVAIRQPLGYVFDKSEELKDTGEFKLNDPFNKDEINKRIRVTHSQIRYLKTVIEELMFFRRLSQHQDIEKLIQEKAKQWVIDDVPLHINSEDADLRDLAISICKKENLYEDYQEQKIGVPRLETTPIQKVTYRNK